ncbi:MAG TPA: anti-sigma factor [Bryobacteraceae bacterium]|nr:anti-sigma factor [Bryobacteraceae bacterium]
MICREVQELIHGYVDGELDLVRNLEMERHFHECPACSGAHERLRTVQSAITTGAPYFRPPSGLESRLRSRLREAAEVDADPPRARHTWQWVGIAAAVLIAALTITVTTRHPAGVELLAQDVVASHVRSLMAAHLTDVPSTDQHTIKPWFNGKLDFSPSVGNFAGQGFPLTGGRLDYLDNRPVAALVYRRRQHIINLFVWPARNQSDSTVRQTELQGYHLLYWTKAGMTYWAASDLNPAELQELVSLVNGL